MSDAYTGSFSDRARGAAGIYERFLDVLLEMQQLESSDASTRAGALRVWSDAELEEMPALEWLADGILPLGGLSAVYGAPGSGKSFAVLDLMFSLAIGRPWFGRNVAQGGSLYVAAEGGSGLSQRILSWKTAHRVAGQSVGVGTVRDSVNLLNPADLGRIVAAARAPQIAEPLRLIVLDTLARSMIGDENDTRDMSALIAASDRIRQATGAAVLLVHHTRKDSDQERGSTALRGAVDTLLLCEDGDDGRQLVCQKQKDAEPFNPIPFQLVAGHGSCVVQASGSGFEDASEQNGTMSSKRLAALRALSEGFTGRGATTTEWGKATTLTERTFYRARTWLVSEGYVAESPRGGRYTITGSGRSAVQSHKMTTATTANVLPKQLPSGSVFFEKKTEPPPNGSSGGSNNGSENGSKEEELYWGQLLNDPSHE